MTSTELSPVLNNDMLSQSEILKMGFAKVGNNVQISERASFYGIDKISLGNNVRIDDFCVLSAGAGGIEIGNYIHIAVYSLLIGAGKITIEDYCNISSRVSIYSSSDDPSGEMLTNPTVPSHLTNVIKKDVTLKKHVLVFGNTTILPGVTLNEGAVIGSHSLVKNNCAGFKFYAGSPAKFIKDRSRKLLKLEIY